MVSGSGRVLIKSACGESAASRKRFVTKVPKLGTKLPKIVFFGLLRRRGFALLAAHRAPTRNADEGEERPMMMPHSAAPTLKSTGAVGTSLGPAWGQTGAAVWRGSKVGQRISRGGGHQQAKHPLFGSG